MGVSGSTFLYEQLNFTQVVNCSDVAEISVGVWSQDMACRIDECDDTIIPRNTSEGYVGDR